MSEEKPNFKVTDRRLFNSDGTPREIEREVGAETDTSSSSSGGGDAPAAMTAATAPVAESAPAQTGVAAPSPKAGADAAPRAPSPLSAESANEPRPASPPAAAAAAPATAPGMLGEAEDPTAFATLVMFIASPAAAAMGMTEHPGLAPGELDLPLAKHCIDLLGTIQQKSHGNLSGQEGQILEGLLAELRMQYISLTSTQRPPARPRGFTGNDITGGR